MKADARTPTQASVQIAAAAIRAGLPVMKAAPTAKGVARSKAFMGGDYRP